MMSYGTGESVKDTKKALLDIEIIKQLKSWSNLKAYMTIKITEAKKQNKTKKLIVHTVQIPTK